MATGTYLVTAKTTSGQGLASVNIAGINQEEPLIDEVALVNAVKEFLLTLPNVGQATATKGEWITTNI